MGTYIIVSILESKFPKTFQYTNWPLHITLLRPFTTDISRDKVIEILQGVCERHTLLFTKGKSRELFGAESDIQATELMNTPELQKLHDNIRSAYIDKIDFTAPQYKYFRPHVTESGDKKVGIGEKIYIKNISLVKLCGEHRDVIFTSALSTQHTNDKRPA